MSLREEARALVESLNQRMSPSAYDAAWMARLRGSDGDPRWPSLTEWLLDRQHADGSWGGAIEYYHDRLISTLAAIIALEENGGSRRALAAVDRGVRYVWHATQRLWLDPFELSGFELIFPTLLAEARGLGLDVPSHAYGYDEVQAEKLKLIPPEMLYSPKISTVYSLEFLGRSVDAHLLRNTIGENASVGNSPATSAYYAMISRNDTTLSYLNSIVDEHRIVTVYPFRIFELSWVLFFLSHSGLPIADLVPEARLDALYGEMSPAGFALDPTFGPTDGDITSVCCAVLLLAGYDLDPDVLRRFQDEQRCLFRTYGYERNVSVTTNVHALNALNLWTEYPNREEVRSEILLTILDSRQHNTFWTDKWHASPYYPSCHALITLAEEGPHLVYACEPTIEWLTHTQRENGSWGFFDHGTAEETAYALTALLHCNRYYDVDDEILHRGADYLMSADLGPDAAYPELWLAKSIYSPYDIVRSGILASLILYEETFGRSL